MILAALNIGRILINFFYAEKLQLCGINETWLAAIIMGYSAIQLLSERILARTKPEHYNQMMALFFILSGIALGVLGLVNVPVWTILFMLILPLFLDIPSYLLGEVQNSIVDAAGREDNRAELLSVFNMGVNVTEIFLSVWLITTGERRVNGLFCHPRCFYDRSWNWHLSFCEERMVAFTSRKKERQLILVYNIKRAYI